MRHPKPIACTFDPDDEDLIVAALRTGQPIEVRYALDYAAAGFRQTLEARGGVPIVDGRPQLMVFTPPTVFDKYVLTIVLQQVADKTGKVVSVHKLPNPEKAGTPWVTFLTHSHG